jgi:haloalkane dehalogenase
VAAGNTLLPTGDEEFPELFFQWRTFAQETPEFPTGGIIDGATNLPLSPDVIAAYDAPYPDESFKAGARVFPILVPADPDNPACAANHAAWKVLERFERPFLTMFSDSDPMTASAKPLFLDRVPGTKGQAHTTIENGGHFLQEDQGERIAEVLNDFIAST